jgi:hypothetical protein
MRSLPRVGLGRRCFRHLRLRPLQSTHPADGPDRLISNTAFSAEFLDHARGLTAPRTAAWPSSTTARALLHVPAPALQLLSSAFGFEAFALNLGTTYLGTHVVTLVRIRVTVGEQLVVQDAF